MTQDQEQAGSKCQDLTLTPEKNDNDTFEEKREEPQQSTMGRACNVCYTKGGRQVKCRRDFCEEKTTITTEQRTEGYKAKGDGLVSTPTDINALLTCSRDSTIVSMVISILHGWIGPE